MTQRGLGLLEPGGSTEVWLDTEHVVLMCVFWALSIFR